MDVRLYWIWMQQALSPGNPKVSALLRHFENAQAVYEADEKDLSSCGLTPAETERLNEKSLEGAQKVLERSLNNGGWVLTPEDRLYPSLLRGIFDLPLVLYGRGDMPNLDILPSIAVVGTRETSG